jgi:hypothetical protein
LAPRDTRTGPRPVETPSPRFDAPSFTLWGACDPGEASSNAGHIAYGFGAMSMPSFLDSYLVAEDSTGAPPVGVVRKYKTWWLAIQIGVPLDEQPSQAFPTRDEAGRWLLSCARMAKPVGK